MTKTKLPQLNIEQIQRVVTTLTEARLSKYLRTANGLEQKALRLYALNTKVSAAFLTDLHYVEVAFRNKFDIELTAGFGERWFNRSGFLALMNKGNLNILRKSQNSAMQHSSKEMAVPPGKVIAELSFGFWQSLTSAHLEHSLWIPYLHKAFKPHKAPKRAIFNQQLEQLRQLRNRIAHHEPVFHLDLFARYRILNEVARLLCPTTALVMSKTSSLRREIMGISRYCSRP